MSAKIDFYTNAMSRGRIAHWMMEELGEAYATHWVDYGEEMKSPGYLAINPMGKVPALVHDGAVVTECAAILTYLAAVYPEKGLIPEAPADLATFYRWMFFAAGPLEQATTTNSMGWEVTAERKPMLGFGDLADTLNAVEVRALDLRRTVHRGGRVSRFAYRLGNAIRFDGKEADLRAVREPLSGAGSVTARHRDQREANCRNAATAAWRFLDRGRNHHKKLLDRRTAMSFR